MNMIYSGPDEGVYNLSNLKKIMTDIGAESVYSQGDSGESYRTKRMVEIFHCSGITIMYHAWCELQEFPVVRFPDFYNVEVVLYGKEEDVKNLESKLKEENIKILPVKHT